MPTYAYQCPECRWFCREIRPIASRNFSRRCNACGGECERVIEAPACNPWKDDRKFPNLSPHGDGTRTFASSAEYEGFLKEKGWGELGINAPKKHKSGWKKVMSDGRSA